MVPLVLLAPSRAEPRRAMRGMDLSHLKAGCDDVLQALFFSSNAGEIQQMFKEVSVCSALL